MKHTVALAWSGLETELALGGTEKSLIRAYRKTLYIGAYAAVGAITENSAKKPTLDALASQMATVCGEIMKTMKRELG